MTNSESNFVISDEMRALIIEYMTACNNQEHAKSEGLLQRIKEQGAIDHEKRTS